MNFFLNQNYIICLKTQIFLLFDLYIIQYDVEKDDTFINQLQEDLRQNNINLDQLLAQYNVVIIKDILSNLITGLDNEEFNSCYKNLNITKIKNDNILPFEVNLASKSVVMVYIQKFDNENYITPLMISYDNNTLNTLNRRIIYSEQLEKLNIYDNYSQMITNFKI